MKYLKLPIAAIRHRPIPAVMILASSTVGFLLFGIAAHFNAFFKHLGPGKAGGLGLDEATAAIIALGLGTIVVLTSTAISQSVRSHCRELAILKSLGFPSGQIILSVLLEAAIPSGSGALCGLALSRPCAIGVLRLLAGGRPFPAPQLSSLAISLAFVAALLLPLTSVLVPACRIIRLDAAATLSR